MIGNDIIDLELVKKESNWKRKGFLDKIYTKREQSIILNSDCSEKMVWNLWSRKEAAYKIFNRKTGIRIYNPTQFECFDVYKSIGRVVYRGDLYLTKTELNSKYIHTVSVVVENDFDNIKTINRSSKIVKIDGIPYLEEPGKKFLEHISISNHGVFERIVKLDQAQPSL